MTALLVSRLHRGSVFGVLLAIGEFTVRVPRIHPVCGFPVPPLEQGLQLTIVAIDKCNDLPALRYPKLSISLLEKSAGRKGFLMLCPGHQHPHFLFQFQTRALGRIPFQLGICDMRSTVALDRAYFMLGQRRKVGCGIRQQRPFLESSFCFGHLSSRHIAVELAFADLETAVPQEINGIELGLKIRMAALPPCSLRVSSSTAARARLNAEMLSGVGSPSFGACFPPWSG